MKNIEHFNLNLNNRINYLTNLDLAWHLLVYLQLLPRQNHR